MAGAERPKPEHNLSHPSVRAIIRETNLPLQGIELHPTEEVTLVTGKFKGNDGRRIDVFIGYINPLGEGYAMKLTNVTPAALRKEILSKQIADGTKTHLTAEELGIINQPDNPIQGGIPFS